MLGRLNSLNNVWLNTGSEQNRDRYFLKNIIATENMINTNIELLLLTHDFHVAFVSKRTKLGEKKWAMFCHCYRHCFLFVASAHAEVLSPLDQVFIWLHFAPFSNPSPLSSLSVKQPGSTMLPPPGITLLMGLGLVSLQRIKAQKLNRESCFSQSESLRFDQSETFRLSPLVNSAVVCFPINILQNDPRFPRLNASFFFKIGSQSVSVDV